MLLAPVYANYKFIVIDVGSSGRECDASNFQSSALSAMMDKNTLKIPKPTKLPKSEDVLPYAVVGDEGFPLPPNIMRPYAGRKTGNLSFLKKVFNYRHVTSLFDI